MQTGLTQGGGEAPADGDRAEDNGRRQVMGRITTLMGALVLVVAACSSSGSPTAVPPSATPAQATQAPATAAAVATPAPATATSLAISASVAFDGKACTYAGPAVVPMGSTVTLTLTSTYAKASMVYVMPVVDGTTWDQIVADTGKIPASQAAAWVKIPGAGQDGYAEIRYNPTSVTTVITRNAYFVGCGTAPTDTDKMFPAVLLKALPA
jgi:hypothetical protein